jgi:hypothetical protein
MSVAAGDNNAPPGPFQFPDRGHDLLGWHVANAATLVAADTTAYRLVVDIRE